MTECCFNTKLVGTVSSPFQMTPLTFIYYITCLLRQGGVSVDCITDLADNQSQLLEALQLSLPVEAAGSRRKRRDKKLSLNPIYRQVPRVVDLCCQHLERHGTCGKKSRSARKGSQQISAKGGFFFCFICVYVCPVTSWTVES